MNPCITVLPSAEPDVSIVMTALNAEKYLAEAIESIVQQKTTLTWELLFVEDGSTDRSFRIACDYAHRFPTCVRVLTHEGGANRGISASRNLGLRHARGPLLTFLDSDDVWLPHFLEEQAALMESMPKVTMVYAGAERWVDFSSPFDESASRAAGWGSNYLPPLIPTGQAAGLLPRGRLLQWFRNDESLVPCICTVMLRTAAARAVGGFCDAFRGLYDDQIFHAKIALSYDIYAHDICVARYRQHEASCCARATESTGERQMERKRFNSFLLAYVEQNKHLMNADPDHETQLHLRNGCYRKEGPAVRPC